MPGKTDPWGLQSGLSPEKEKLWWAAYRAYLNSLGVDAISYAGNGPSVGSPIPGFWPVPLHPGIDGDYNYVVFDGHHYWPFWDKIGLKEDYFDENGDLKCASDLRCLQQANVANETWHAWWDQVLTKKGECKWLYAKIKAETSKHYGLGRLNLEFAEEAMSETASSWALSSCRSGLYGEPLPSTWGHTQTDFVVVTC